jgi:hypothetical protein
VPDQTGWRTKFNQKTPRIRSTAKWNLLSYGYLPPPRVTYDTWIICQPYFSNLKYQAQRVKAQCGSDISASVQVMWSPRRHHASVMFNGFIWVLGGRARELVDFSEDESVGGIIGPHVKDVDTGINAQLQLLTTQREASIAKSDVWKSADGVKWTLVTPGCKAPQSLLVPDGNDRENKHGQQIYACVSDADCYGAEQCDLVKLTCVCSMWTSREQHAVAVYGDYMYVTGGYASFLYSKENDCGAYPCGDTDASSYRYALNDVWRSKDGDVWEPVTQIADFPGRGGHEMMAIQDAAGSPYLWIFGGRGMDNSGLSNSLMYYNDIWTSPLAANNPLIWTQMALNPSENITSTSYSMPWSPRMGHTVSFIDASASNGGVRTLFLVGGLGADGTFYDDVWSWRLSDVNSTWIQDFAVEALYSTVHNGAFGYFNNSPLVQQYITLDSDVSLLQLYWVPSYPIAISGQSLEKREYLTNQQIQMLRDVNISTIRDFATADKYKILKLRGFDIPQVPLSQRLTFTGVCDARALAIAAVKKCSLSAALDDYYAESLMPWNVVNVYDGPPPSKAAAAWHGVYLRIASQHMSSASDF